MRASKRLHQTANNRVKYEPGQMHVINLQSIMHIKCHGVKLEQENHDNHASRYAVGMNMIKVDVNSIIELYNALVIL